MNDVSRLVIAARLDAVRHACDFVVEAAEAAHLDERTVYHCQMAVDEALTNIIEHGYTYQGNDRQIEITCQVEPERVVITIIDDSPAFNPLTHDTPDPAEPLDSREPGGWGIYFIRKLMNDVQYQRVGDRNHLVLIKQLPAPEAVTQPGDESDTFPVSLLETGAVKISPAGRLDSKNSPVLEKTLYSQLEQGHSRLFVDMVDVEYISSSGLKVLVSAWRRAQDNGGDVILSGLQPRLIEILEMVGFDMLFQIFPDLDTALAAHSKKP
jgi:anti-anti-sigma factor